jgi:hypothetical protein
MSWGAVAGAAISVVGGAIMSDGSKSAAQGQSDATAQSNALQQYMYDNNVRLQMPTINTGNAARDRLSYLLGLSPSGFSGTINGAPKLTYDQLRSQLLGQYTKQRSATSGAADLQSNGQYQALIASGYGPEQAAQIVQTGNSLGRPGGTAALWTSPDEKYSPGGSSQGGDSYIDENALDAAIKQRLADQDAAQRALEEAAKNDPNYGRLAQQYVPDKFSFTSQDFLNNKDPGYEWRLQQGQKALDRQGAAAGRFLSGAQLQASSNYNQGAASQEFGNAYSRALSTFGTNEGNRFNAYQANFNNAVNPLLALSGAATLGSQNLGNAGSAYAAQVGNNLQNNANAQGAAGIAGANSIAGGLSNAYNGYQQNQLLNGLLNNRGGVNNNPSGVGLGGLDAATVYGAGSGWGNA